VNSLSANPLIVQSDRTVLVEVDNPRYELARDQLSRFAELEKSPEYVHSYRITPLSLWNAAAAGLDAGAIIASLQDLAKYPVPDNVSRDISDYVARYGRVKLVREDSCLYLVADDLAIMSELSHQKRLLPYLLESVSPLKLRVDPRRRGHVKQALVAMGYPVEDLAGYVQGAPLPHSLRRCTLAGEALSLRPYQVDAACAFYAGGSSRGGSGVVVLPCGAGKTVVGLAVMAKTQCATLVLTTNTIAARQWMSELLDKTDLRPEDIGEYSGDCKQVRPVTISTYQMMTYHAPQREDEPRSQEVEYPHFSLFNEQDWGLIIYDEVHLLPAPVFRITAEIQSRRRLGLTATLVREDGRETDVFSLIGPKKYDAPWKDLERQGWIATAECHEVRIALDEALRLDYAIADDRDRYRVAAENPRKLEVLESLMSRHADDSVLIIGVYLSQLSEVAQRYGLPVITGKTPLRERESLYDRFRSGALKRLIVSKVGNFAVDLPDANVAIQISGSFGSRQEEAQRLGRILRPKRLGTLAHFYTLVTRDTRDQDCAAKRQLFLTEQGYHYDILYEDEVH